MNPGQPHVPLAEIINYNYGEFSVQRGVPDGSAGKEYACNAGDTRNAGLIPGSGRSPGGGDGHPLQYFCLKNPTDRGTWQATVHTVTKSQRQLSD